jgi:hypothetical protein
MPLFNPLKRNGVSPEDQMLWLLSAIRACHRSDSFDEQPQRFRWMGNSLLPVIEGNGSFEDALDMLDHNRSGVRDFFLAATSNPRVVAEWCAYEDLSPTRRREETYSSYGWLRKFVVSKTFRHMTRPHPDSFEPKEFLMNAGILLSTFPRFRPLDADSVNFLRSTLLQLLVMSAFSIPLTQRPRLILVLDEAEHALERDGELLGTILAEGRSLGIHLILIFHTFSQITKHNPELLASVLTHCKTKILAGRLYHEDLEVLSKDLFVEEWHPRIIRDEIYALEVEPVETTRETVSRAYSYQKGTSVQYPHSTTISKGQGESEGKQESHGLTDTMSQSEALSHANSRAVAASRAESENATLAIQHTRSRAIGESQAETRMRSESEMSSENWMDGASSMQGMADSLSTGMAMSYSMDSLGMAGMPMGMTNTANSGLSFNSANSMSSSRGGGVGRVSSAGQAESRAQSLVEGESIGEAVARGRGTTNAISTSQGSSEATMQGRSTGQSTNVNFGTTHQTSTNTTLGETRGETPGENETEGWTETRSMAPFHELHKRWKVASREFLSLQDFLTTKLIQLRGAKKAYWVVQAPEGKAILIKARTVRPLPGGKELLPALYRVAFDRPAWRAARESLSHMLESSAGSIDVQGCEIVHEQVPQGEITNAGDAPEQSRVNDKSTSDNSDECFIF